LVPDAPGQLTSDHGWTIAEQSAALKPIVARLAGTGIRVSLFVDADYPQLELARDVGADRIELYTEPYALAFGTSSQDDVLALFARAVQRAQAVGLGVNAGHDLNLENLATFLKINGILEVSIGHALIVECLYYGLEKVVPHYVRIANGVLKT
jgi:pyridoxine 5-phosphate synthase